MSDTTSDDTESPDTITSDTPLANGDEDRATALLYRAQAKADAGDIKGAQLDLDDARAIRRGERIAERPEPPPKQAAPGTELIIRDQLGRFAPGSLSTARRGRTGFQGLARHVRDETRGGLELVEFALRVLRDEDQAMKDRLSALAWLGDRGFGRPVQAVELVADVQAHATIDPVQVLARLSDTALRELAEAHDALKLGDGGDDEGNEP